ncbi:hypothetical protein MMC07_007610 [Pseudocyphellaria aurata]|nr:hypothetical protein [Pseudocyphellaria aurata]
MYPSKNEILPGSNPNSAFAIPRRPVPGSQRDSARVIRRRPVPPPQQGSSREQEGSLGPQPQTNPVSDQICDEKLQKVQGLQIKPSKEDQTQEPAFISGGCVTGQTQAVEIWTDDNESISSSSSEPLPTYEQTPQGVHINQAGFQARATAAYDGRIDINIDSSARRLSRLFAPALQTTTQLGTGSVPPFSALAGDAIGIPTPKLNVVIQIVGCRGDVQPFISLGLALKMFGHRVRIATHPTFQGFIEDLGLEFFSLGGDPAELTAFMVKNPGLMPSFDTVRNGEVHKRRKAMRDIFNRCWRSCIEAGNGLDPMLLDSSEELKSHKGAKPFVADAIISNPPTFAHIHCAEKLGIPLHLMFTMPWSPTQAFAHPLANIKSTNENPTLSNYLSYLLIDLMIWQGLGDVINRFRRKVLGLEALDSTWAPGMITRLGIPQTYCWYVLSSSNGGNITIAGFYFLPLASSYFPPPDLQSFLKAGPPPIYIGFGSVVVHDPDILTSIVFEAIQIANVRAIVSEGSGSIRGSATAKSPNVFMIENCPHDWLFEQVSCVVHHGVAETTAAGIAAGKPTVIVPFFGDQPFWGNTVASAGAGPRPISSKLLTASNLAAAIIQALQPGTKEIARNLGLMISEESGIDIGAKSFHDQLPLSIMGCSMAPLRSAVWTIGKKRIKLSALAATVLWKEGVLDIHELKLGTLAVVDLFYDVFKGMGEIGSEFVRVPNIGLNKANLAKDEQAYYPHRPPVLSSTNRKIVGQRAAKGISRIGKAAFRSPMTFTIGMAQGAHNLPKVWGDKTVRPQEKITGFGSGLKAAVKGLTYGTYDGITGIFTQPIVGARDEGVLGATKGLGRGAAGVFIKPFGGASAMIGYSLKGIDAEFTKAMTHKILDPIVSARLAQGELEYLEVSKEEKKEIIQQWYSNVAEKNKEKKANKQMQSKDKKGKGKEKEATKDTKWNCP